MNKKYKILAVIPARGGSKGVPRKNIRKLGGKPLICRMINSAIKSKMITHVALSSEDKEILSVANKCGKGNKKFFLVNRPQKLALDSTPSLPVVQHAVEDIEKREKIKFDYIVLLQPISPFIYADDIDKSVKKLIKTKADSVVSVYRVSGGMHPIKMKKIVNDRLLQYVDGMKETIFRRQDLAPVYKRNGGIYAVTRRVIMKNIFPHGFFMGKTVRPYIMPAERSIDIDTEIDFLLAEIMEKKLKNAK